MFDIGFWEIATIGVVSLLVIGPEKLPKVAKTVGSFVGKAQRYIQNVKGDLQRDFDTDDLMQMMQDQKKTIERLQSDIQDNVQTIEKESQEIAQSIDDGDQPEIEEIDDNRSQVKIK